MAIPCSCGVLCKPQLLETIIERIKSVDLFSQDGIQCPALILQQNWRQLVHQILNRVLLTPMEVMLLAYALKLARAVKGRLKVSFLWDSFHGASLDAISVGGNACSEKSMGH